MHFKTAQFDGPLDMLLSLIHEKKMEINAIALSEVTDQYMSYVEHMDEERPHELADFLLVATKLLLMKSKQLLPHFFPEDEDEESLEDQLKLYKAFVEASKHVNKKWLADARGAFRLHPSTLPEVIPSPENLTTDNLRASMVQLLGRLKPLKPLPKVSIDKTVSLKEKLVHIKEMIAKAGKISFHEAVSNHQNKSEMIVSFLAMLELVKQRSVCLAQHEPFGDISIESV